MQSRTRAPSASVRPFVRGSVPDSAKCHLCCCKKIVMSSNLFRPFCSSLSSVRYKVFLLAFPEILHEEGTLHCRVFFV